MMSFCSLSVRKPFLNALGGLETKSVLVDLSLSIYEIFGPAGSPLWLQAILYSCSICLRLMANSHARCIIVLDLGKGH
jgi:hypothetical protein